MAGIQVTVNAETVIARWAELEKRLDVATDAGLLAEGRAIRGRYRRFMGKKSKRLFNSVYVEIVGRGKRKGIRVGSNVPYAEIHERGARRHVITPKRAGGVLRFNWNGRIVYRTYVNHPGHRGNPALRRATEQYRSGRVPLLRRRVQEVLSG